VVQQAARVQRWLPWKVMLLLLAGTVLVHAVITARSWWPWATERQELRQATALTRDLDRYLRETLYAQLAAPQQQALDTIHRTHAVPSPSTRLP
jgi:hypothetical protein